MRTSRYNIDRECARNRAFAEVIDRLERIYKQGVIEAGDGVAVCHPHNNLSNSPTIGHQRYETMPKSGFERRTAGSPL